MPAIPLPGPAKSTRLNPEVGAPGSNRSGEQYGAPQAEALGQIGQGIQQLGSALSSMFAKQQAERDQEKVSTGLLNASYQERHNNNIINYEDPSGKGLVEFEQADYMKFVEEKTADFAKSGASTAAQRDFRIKLLNMGKQYIDTTAVTASKMAEANATTELDKGISTLLNGIGTHGRVSKEEHVTDVSAGEKAINDSRLDKNTKLTRIQKLRNDAAIVHFNAVKNAAKTPAEIQAALADLHTEFWRKQLDTPDYMKVEGALSATAEALAQIDAKSASDPFINKTRLDPTGYDANMAAGEKAIREQPGIDPAEANKQVANYKSDHTRMYFEALAEAASTYGVEGLRSGKLKSTEEALKGIQEIRDELAKDPKWGATMTSEQMENLLNNLDVRENKIETVFNGVQSDLTEKHNALVTETRAEFKSSMQSINERLTAGETPPPSDYEHILELGGALTAIDGMTPEITKQYLEIKNKYGMDKKVKASGGDAKSLDRLEREVLNKGGGSFRLSKDGRTMELVPKPTVASDDGEHAEGGSKVRYAKGSTKILSEGGGGRAQVTVNIRDRTSVQGMTKRAHTILDAGAANARSHGVVRLEIVAGVGGGHKSHGAGTEWDIVGYQANGQVWTDEQRAAVARDMMGGGADRIGLYEGGSHRNLLHIGYSHSGFGAAMWGAGGLTSGEASRQYRGAGSRRLLAEFRGGSVRDTGGGGGGGRSRGGGFYADLRKFENAPGDPRAVNPIMTSSGRASGLYQITEDTWADFGGLKTGYKTAGEAPPDIQKQIADKIPIERWAPETLNKMQKAGWTIHPGKTLAENAALNGDDGSGGDVGTGGDTGSGDGRDLTVPEGITQAQHDQLSIINKARQDLEVGLRTDPMTTGAALLRMPELELLGSEKSYEDRAKLFNKLDSIHGFTAEQTKILTQKDVVTLSGLLNSNDSEKINQVYAGIGKWTPRQQEAAWKQLGETAPFGAAAGRLYASGRKDIANLAQRGHEGLVMMDDNKTPPVWTDESKKWFGGMGDVLRGLTDPTHGVGIKQVIDAVYWARHSNEDFDPAHYQKAAEDVMGVKFDTVHGHNVALIPGTTGKEWEIALPALDLTAVSLTGTPPVAEDVIKGGLALVSPVAQENAIPIRYTENQYMFMDTDGNLFHTITAEKTEQYPNGKPQIYVAQLTADVIHQAAAKGQKEAEAEAMRPESRPSTGYDPSRGPPTRRVQGSGHAESRLGRSLQFEIDPERPAPGTPLPPAASFTQREGPWTPEQEKALEDYADDYADMLRRNGAEKAEVDAARSQLLDDIRRTRRTVGVGRQ